MKNRAIVFTAINTAELLTQEVQTPKANQVTVKLAVSTISNGTERANIIGDPNVHGRAPGRVDFPRTAGYSSAGTVVAVGDAVEDLQVGDRVALSWSKHSEYVTLDR